MFYILYVDMDGNKTWELIDGEDAMQIRVSELVSELDADPEDIIVIPTEAELG